MAYGAECGVARAQNAAWNVRRIRCWHTRTVKFDMCAECGVTHCGRGRIGCMCKSSPGHRCIISFTIDRQSQCRCAESSSLSPSERLFSTSGILVEWFDPEGKGSRVRVERCGIAELRCRGLLCGIVEECSGGECIGVDCRSASDTRRFSASAAWSCSANWAGDAPLCASPLCEAPLCEAPLCEAPLRSGSGRPPLFEMTRTCSSAARPKSSALSSAPAKNPTAKDTHDRAMVGFKCTQGCFSSASVMLAWLLRTAAVGRTRGGRLAARACSRRQGAAPAYGKYLEQKFWGAKLSHL